MEQSNYALSAIDAVIQGEKAFCKFLSANDTGDTGAHQAGIYITKSASAILFDTPGEKGSMKEKNVTIKWQDDFVTESRFIYYGQKTRNEYRITRFGRGFPFLRTEHTGDLFVLVQQTPEEYVAYVLATEEEIDDFLDAFGMSPADTGELISEAPSTLEYQVDLAMKKFIDSLSVDFPSSKEMSDNARKIHYDVFNHYENIIKKPDQEILSWTDMEYKLFRKLEFVRYGNMITQGFKTVEEFVEVANKVLNRRKSRAGKSLENHLAAIFDGNNVYYEEQVKTEGNKRPDFIFPGSSAYHTPTWPEGKLIFLGAKTTCKDRWRQIINEANRIPVKHLFTLQQGISAQQLDEMKEEQVILVVPEPYIRTYPKEKRPDIWTLQKFIDYTKEKLG